MTLLIWLGKLEVRQVELGPSPASSTTGRNVEEGAQMTRMDAQTRRTNLK